MTDLITHFREKEMVDKGQDGRVWSTRDRCDSTLNCWIEPRWGKEELTDIRTPPIKEWLGKLKHKPRKRKASAGRKREGTAFPCPRKQSQDS